LDRLRDNAAAVQRAIGSNAQLVPMVKADAYGLGMEAVATALREYPRKHDPWAFGVATVAEGERLRRSGWDGRILVFAPAPRAEFVAAGLADLTLCLSDITSVESLAQVAAEFGRRLPFHVEVDTGMGRGGLPPDRVVDAVGRLQARSAPVKAIWTHLASPDDAARSASQVAVFDRLSTRLAELGIHPELRHLAASGGLLCGAPCYDLVRVGLAYYGLDPFPFAGSRRPSGDLTPALSVRARAVRIEDVPAGTPIGYDGTWVSSRPSRIATIPIGYVDSWSRTAGARTSVLVRGRRAPVVGRISSDSMGVDVTDVPGLDAADVFVLLGRDGDETISAEDVAAARGTITWEVLQTLSARLARVYTLDGSVVAQRSPASMRLSTALDLEPALTRTAAAMRQAGSEA
jgi:alanine racemase